MDRWTKDLAIKVRDSQGTHRAQLLGGQGRPIDLRFTVRPAPGHQGAGAATEGTLAAVVDYFQHLRPQRLVITGEPGAGKTVLVTELIVGLLKDGVYRPEDPVPVLIPAASWDPRVPVTDWLAAHLRKTFQLSAETARALVTAHRVIPVIDGLDEMDNTESPGYVSLAGRALQALNAYQHQQPDARLVLTCRSAVYDALAIERVTPAGSRTVGVWVHRATRIELTPVSPDRAWAFIEAVVGEHQRQRWEPVLDALTRPGHPLASVLSTPWRLTLAATVYQPNPLTGVEARDPLDLAGRPGQQPRTAEQIRDHLLELYIEAAIMAVRAISPDRPIHPPEKVRSWLTVLARYLNSTDLLAAHPPGTHPSRSDLILHELWPLGGPFFTILMETAYLTWPPCFALGFAWRPALAALLVATSITTAWQWRRLPPRRIGLSQMRSAPSEWLLKGCGFGALFGLAGMVIAGTLTGVIAGVFAGLGWGLAYAVRSSGIGVRADPRGPVRNDLTAWVIGSLTLGPLIGGAPGILAWAYPGSNFGIGLIVGSIFAGPAVTTMIGGAASIRYMTMLLYMRVRGRLPLRLGRFLHWCYTDVGLMRIAGIAYQFRHRELQDYLATHPAPP